MASPWESSSAPPPGSRGPPRARDEVTQAGDNVTKLLSIVSQMRKMVTEMGTAKDTVQHRQKLKQTREQGTQVAGETMKLLQVKSPQAEDAAYKRRLATVMTNYKRAVSDLQTVEQEYMAKEKAVPKPTAAAVSVDNPLRGGAAPHRGGAVTAEQDVQLQILQEQQLQSQQRQMDIESAAELRAAHQDLVSLASMVTDINQMLSVQGEHLTVVVDNTATTVDNVQAGEKDLSTARDYLNRYRCQCAVCWTILGVGIVLAIVLGVLKAVGKI